MILSRLKTEQRKPEAILATALPMTPTSVASVLGEHGHDLTDEVDRRIVSDAFDDQRHCHLSSSVNLCNHLPFAISERHQHAAWLHGSERCRLDTPGDEPCHIDGIRPNSDTGGDQLSAITASHQPHRPRLWLTC